jgi:plasmid maintenance system killer protein
LSANRDKRTREFAGGKRVKAFSGFERSARLKLDRMEAATSMNDLAALPGNHFESLVGVTARASTASALTINGGFASSGLTERRGHQTWRLSTITRELCYGTHCYPSG